MWDSSSVGVVVGVVSRCIVGVGVVGIGVGVGNDNISGVGADVTCVDGVGVIVGGPGVGDCGRVVIGGVGGRVCWYCV